MISDSNDQTVLTSHPSVTFSIPNVVLKSTLNNNKETVNICHLNAQSLLHKVDELKIIFDKVNAHAICISESRLHAHIPDQV